MKSITAEILTIGDEILFGQITDTNSQWISTELTKIGVKVLRKSSVGDLEIEILKAFEEAESRADIILITGGLGPTNDDITKKCLCSYFNSELEINEEALRIVSDFFTKRGRQLTELNRLQAAIPKASEPILNYYGTATGMWFSKNNKVFLSMPGVPFEMKGMMTDEIIPKLLQTFQTPTIYHQIIKTVGIGESFLAEKIKNWEDDLPPHIKLAYLPSLGEVKLRLTSTGDKLAELESQTKAQIDTLIPLIGDYVYGFNDTSLINAIAELLTQKKLTVATAESCTGGYIAHQLTSLSGSSRYFKGSIVAYSNEIKTSMLNVSENTLDTHGAVSEEVVSKMAEQVRLKLNTDIGIACSGIAGPDGGTTEKPVGTVWIAYATNQQTITKKLFLGNLRDNNIKLTCTHLLNLLRQHLINS